MTAKKYFPIALFIGLQAAVLQAIDQAICAGIVPPFRRRRMDLFPGLGRVLHGRLHR